MNMVRQCKKVGGDLCRVERKDNRLSQEVRKGENWSERNVVASSSGRGSIVATVCPARRH
jgi:hypothetical protein